MAQVTHRWQYPARTELILPEELRPEVTSVDKYWAQASEPVRTAPQPVAEGGSPFQIEQTLATNALQEMAVPPDPVRLVPQAQMPAFSIGLPDSIVAPSITVANWYVQHHNPPLPAPPTPETGETRTLLEFLILPNVGWLMPPADVVTPLPRLNTGSVAELIIPESLRTEVTSVDKYYQQAPPPVIPPPRLVPGEAFFVPNIVEAITMDKWYRQTNEPVRPFKIRPPLGGEAVRPSIIVGAVTFEQFGSIELPIDTGDHPDDAVYRFQGMMKTSSAANSAQLRFFNVTDNSAVVIINSVSLTPKFVQSGPITLLSGEKAYRVDIGGALNGGTYSASMAKLEVVAS